MNIPQFYDDGNLLQGYHSRGHGMFMTYDTENRLASAEFTDGSGGGSQNRYSYKEVGCYASRYVEAAALRNPDVISWRVVRY